MEIRNRRTKSKKAKMNHADERELGRKAPEQRPEASSKIDPELIEIADEECEEIGPDGGYGGAGLDQPPRKH